MVHRVVTGKYTPDARPTQTVNRSARAADGTRTHLRRLSELIVAEELVAHSLEPSPPLPFGPPAQGLGGRLRW